MTTPSGHPPQTRARSKAVVLCAAAVFGLSLLFGSGLSPAALAQGIPSPSSSSSTTSTRLTTTTTISPTTTTPSDWAGSQWTSPTTDGATVADGMFSGVFRHQPSTPAIDSVELRITYPDGVGHAPACGLAPGPYTQQAPSSPSTTDPSDSTTMNFSFEVGFRCNGSYDVTATAQLDGPAGDVNDHELLLRSIRVAVPPQAPTSIVATDNGNRTVTIAWEPPNEQPPDLVGYRVSRREASSSNVEVLTDTTVDARSYDDSNIPSGGGSYYYRVQTLRSSPTGVLASDAIPTSAPLAVGGPGGGGSVGGTPVTRDPGSGGTGTQYFDDTLPADEGEFGAGDPFANVPGGDTVQRFVGQDGAGLVTPSAVALNIAVWAGLLLFLTRRAAKADRADRLALQIEHPA